MKRINLQNIVIPTDEQFHLHWDLFYCASRLWTDENGLFIPKNTIVDFASYINGFPFEKWRDYTNINYVELNCVALGEFDIILTGYSLSPRQPVRKEYSSVHFSENMEDVSLVLPYPNSCNEAFLAFEFVAKTDCILKKAFFSGEVEENALRSVNLCISTTTFRKEKYIIRNLNSLKKELLHGDDEIREHLYINVIDNGMTLRREDVGEEHINIIYNDNVGGAGGAARGMIEALDMQADITHILLMDDDVLVLPESIRRTFWLLCLSKEKYKNAFISGAMLELDSMWTMYEDIGYLQEDKSFRPLKPQMDVRELGNVLRANLEYPPHKNMYAGWWYCCVPLAIVREKGLPLPLFIRGDDVEYGIRCADQIMTMSGICIWHQSFRGKYNAATNLYQEFRNVLIIRDCHSELTDVDVFRRWKQECLRAALTFDYDGWELLLLAMEDYLKGPSFISQPLGTEILKRNKQFTEQMIPLSELVSQNDLSFNLSDLKEDDLSMSLSNRLLYYLTINGQRGLKISDRTGVGLMEYEWDHKPGRNCFKKSIVVIDLVNMVGHVRKKNTERFKRLVRRERRDTQHYKRHHEKLEKAYKGSFPSITSIAFWKKYLHYEQNLSMK